MIDDSLNEELQRINWLYDFGWLSREKAAKKIYDLLVSVGCPKDRAEQVVKGWSSLKNSIEYLRTKLIIDKLNSL